MYTISSVLPFTSLFLKLSSSSSCSSSLSPPPPSMATNPEKSSPPAKKARKEGRSSKIPPLTHYLPEDILEIAMTFLPLKEAARMSTVATRFSNTWCFNKKFVFDKEFALKNDQQALAALVDHLLGSHRGDEIQCFHLHVDPIGVQPLIVKWLGICGEKKTEDIQLNFLRQGFRLSQDAIECLSENLKSLKLARCGLMMPPVTRSMQFLHTVVLKEMELRSYQLESLVWHCRALVNLELFQCYGLQAVTIFARAHRHLRMVKISECNDVDWMMIDSPTIHSFFYSGFLPTLYFGGFGESHLQEAIFNFVLAKGILSGGYTEHHRVKDLVNTLHNITILTISAHFLESLSARIGPGWVFRGPDFRLVHLRELQLLMEASSYCNPYDILLFVKNCPNLERLFIDMHKFNFDCGMYWELHQKPMLDEFKHYFIQLRTVKIKGFRFERGDLVLVKYLLQRSMVLEHLILVTQKNGFKYAPKWNDLFHSWKASPLLKIQLYEQYDKSNIKPTHSKNWR